LQYTIIWYYIIVVYCASGCSSIRMVEHGVEPETRHVYTRFRILLARSPYYIGCFVGKNLAKLMTIIIMITYKTRFYGFLRIYTRTNKTRAEGYDIMYTYRSRDTLFGGVAGFKFELLNINNIRIYYIGSVHVTRTQYAIYTQCAVVEADNKVSTEVKTFAQTYRGNPAIFKGGHFYYSSRSVARPSVRVCACVCVYGSACGWVSVC